MNSSPNTACIIGIGTAVPPHKISQTHHHSILESANGLDRTGRMILRTVYQNSGIESRHSVLEEFGREDGKENIIFHPAGHSPHVSISTRMQLFESFAGQLAADAVKNSITDLHSGILSNVTHLITFSCTGMSAPGIDIEIVEKLGLPRSVERTCINFMGCYAGINALKSADYIVRAQPDAVVVVAGVELCTIHYQKNNTQDQTVANAIFADGSAAAIVCSVEKSESLGATTSFSLKKFYSEFEPGGADEMVWRIGDYGFDIKLSSYIPDLIESNIASLIAKLFSAACITQKDIDWYALHPGGVKILQACEKPLGISPEKNKFSYDVLKEYGNMSSVTVFFVLKKYFSIATSEDSGKRILSCGFGPGLTMESMILQVN